MENDRALKEEVIRHVKTLPDDRLREVLRFVESLHTSDLPSQSIEERIATIVSEESEEVWEDVPSDGAQHHDHYIYGRPKQDT